MTDFYLACFKPYIDVRLFRYRVQNTSSRPILPAVKQRRPLIVSEWVAIEYSDHVQREVGEPRLGEIIVDS